MYNNYIEFYFATYLLSLQKMLRTLNLFFLFFGIYHVTGKAFGCRMLQVANRKISHQTKRSITQDNFFRPLQALFSSCIITLLRD